MKIILIGLIILIQIFTLSAQKLEQGFNYSFEPTEYTPRYYVVTEKMDSLWHRQAWYLPERGMAMEGWYRDKEGKVAQGTVRWYHTNKILKSKGVYINGKKEGTWLEYDEEGALRDSAFYVAGKLKGVRMHWYADGMPADSMQFDGAGNGVEVSWYEDGHLSSVGRWVSDTVKRGRWTYYHRNGKVMATEDYAEGKEMDCNCFDEEGKALDTAACSGNEAVFPGGDGAWVRFIQRNLKPDVPVRKGAPVGKYTVVVQFIVSTDGRVEGIKSLTRFGFGMEEEVERMLKGSPSWEPAQRYGRKVKAYRKQPITFAVSNG